MHGMAERDEGERSLEDIVITTFPERNSAREGMAELRRLHDTGALKVRAAAVVERRADGSWLVDKGASHLTFGGAVAGGLVGLLVGALLGPVAALLGGTLGLVEGALLDVVEDETRELTLEVMIHHIPPGTTAIVADVEEETGDTLEAAMSKFGGRVKRWPRTEVSAELGTADEAVEAAGREMRRILHQSRTEPGLPANHDGGPFKPEGRSEDRP